MHEIGYGRVGWSTGGANVRTWMPDFIFAKQRTARRSLTPTHTCTRTTAQRLPTLNTRRSHPPLLLIKNQARSSPKPRAAHLRRSPRNGAENQELSRGAWTLGAEAHERQPRGRLGHAVQHPLDRLGVRAYRHLWLRFSRRFARGGGGAKRGRGALRRRRAS